MSVGRGLVGDGHLVIEVHLARFKVGRREVPVLNAFIYHVVAVVPCLRHQHADVVFRACLISRPCVCLGVAQLAEIEPRRFAVIFGDRRAVADLIEIEHIEQATPAVRVVVVFQNACVLAPVGLIAYVDDKRVVGMIVSRVIAGSGFQRDSLARSRYAVGWRAHFCSAEIERVAAADGRIAHADRAVWMETVKNVDFAGLHIFINADRTTIIMRIMKHFRVYHARIESAAVDGEIAVLQSVCIAQISPSVPRSFLISAGINVGAAGTLDISVVYQNGGAGSALDGGKMHSSAVDVAAVHLKIAAVLNRDAASLKLQAQISGIR